MLVRTAENRDAQAICQISSQELGYPCAVEFVLKRLQNLDSSREIVFVAQTEDTVAGYLHAQIYCTLYMEPMINILGLAVSSHFQRQGMGRALLGAAENWARQQGIGMVRLNSGGSRKQAHQFYRAMGYTSEKQQIRFLKYLKEENEKRK